MIHGRFLLVASLLLPLPILATDFYAAPNGTPSGNGSKTNPWTLATALAQPSAVRPGDTIWLRGGTYVGHFTSTLTGNPGKPIVVKQYPGERATIDGNDGGNAVTLLINGSDTWYWGFEITNSTTFRLATNSNDNPPGQGEGINLLGARTRLINLAIHDTAQGVLTTTDIPDTEITGCLIYYNGYDGPDRGHGHGIYIQNAAPSTKRVMDNVIFSQYGYGIHAYTESGQLDNLEFEGNTSFNNGMLSHVSGPTTDILVGAAGSAASSAAASAKVAKNTILKNNYTNFAPSGGTAVNLGYSKGIASPTLVNNYFVGATGLAFVNAFPPITMTGNSIWGDLAGFDASAYPANTYFSSRPTGVQVFARANYYELGRANITIYNWDKAATVLVDLQGVIPVGEHYELRDAQNFFGLPVLTGVYDGNPLIVPMNGLTPAEPVGLPTPASTAPDFAVFVIVPTVPPYSPRSHIDRAPGAPGPTVVVRPTAASSPQDAPARVDPKERPKP
jgi:hypothetical protein